MVINASEAHAQQALKSSTAALVVAAACTALFLPPMLAHTVESVLRMVLVGTALATAAVLHWAFLGIAAHVLGRSVLGWVGLSLLLFPVGSVTALVLVGWRRGRSDATAAAA